MITKEESNMALEAVKQACILCRNVSKALVSEETLTKKDRSPVTVADFGAQALIISCLSRHFPTIPFVAEEDTGDLEKAENRELLGRIITQVQSLQPRLDQKDILAAIAKGDNSGGSQGRFWALDPIDGTKGFLRKEQYAVALGLVEEGRVIFGILGCPNLPDFPPDNKDGCIFFATKGSGAFVRKLDGESARPIHVSSEIDITRAVFCESVEFAHTKHDDAARIAEQLGVIAPPVRIDSQCKYAAVARGEASVYLRLPVRPGYEERIWDHAAGAIIAEEAGGMIADIEGKPLDFSCGPTLKNNRGVVLASKALFPQVMESVRDVLANSSGDH